MREWGAMHPALRAVLVGAAVCAVILGAGLLAGSPADDAIANAVFYALIFSGVIFLTARRSRATSAELDRAGQSLMYLRYPNSLPGSLSGIWEMGFATAGPGRIDFQPALNDELVPSGRNKALTALRVMSLPRKASHKDTHQGLPVAFLIITLESDSGIIEVAANLHTLQKIQKDIGPARP